MISLPVVNKLNGSKRDSFSLLIVKWFRVIEEIANVIQFAESIYKLHNLLSEKVLVALTVGSLNLYHNLIAHMCLITL
jgi:hypothetical protein